MTTVGAAIREARSARGWSQGTLAEVLGCDTSAVSLIETGRRGLSTRMALKLAAALGGDAADWQRLDLARAHAEVAAPTGGRSHAVPASVIAAARAVFRSARIEGEGHALSVAVDGRALWALGTALDEEGARCPGAR